MLGSICAMLVATGAVCRAMRSIGSLAERLEMEPPRLVVSAHLFEDEGTPAAAERGGDGVFVNPLLLAEHGQRPLGVWAALAHEVAHTYWAQHPDVCSGFPEPFEDEDGADYVAGQLAAAFGQPLDITRQYLELLLHIGATESPEHRDPMTRWIDSAFSSRATSTTSRAVLLSPSRSTASACDLKAARRRFPVLDGARPSSSSVSSSWRRRDASVRIACGTVATALILTLNVRHVDPAKT